MAFQQILRDTAANWANLNPILEANQIGVESDIRNNAEDGTLFAKLGNGIDNWNDLPYWTGTFNADGILDLTTGTPDPTDYFPFVDGSTLKKALINNGVKVYRALLTQTGTNAPTATVLENTLGGTIVWTYADVGLYVGTLEGAFTANKTCLPPVNASQTLDGATSFVETSFFRADADVVRLQTALVDAAAGTQTLSNAFLTNAYVEILVYP